MAAAPVVHFEIIGKDGEKLKTFYGDLFDWEIDSNNPMNYGSVKAAAEGSIGGGVSAGTTGQPGYVTFYAAVSDVKAALAKAEQLGGKTVVPETEIPNSVTFGLFSDPEGHIVGVVKQ